MRGRGLSQRVPYGAHRASDYAEDVLALIEQLGLHQPVLVGHSLGARVVAAARAGVPGASPAWWPSTRRCPGPAAARTR